MSMNAVVIRERVMPRENGRLDGFVKAQVRTRYAEQPKGKYDRWTSIMLCGTVYIVQAVAPKAVPCRRARRTRLRLICARLTGLAGSMVEYVSNKYKVI
jgi:hypothetical protein